MLSRAEARPSGTALLTIHGVSGSWALPSSAVQSVEPLDAAATDSPLDVLALLGIAPGPATLVPRVLVLQVAGKSARVLVRGSLSLREAAADDLLPLPPALRQCAPFVSHVAVVDGKASVFVVSPERLLQAAQSQDRSPSPLSLIHI